MRVGAADTGEVVLDIDGRQMRCTWMEAMEIGAQLIAWAGWASAEVDADAGLVHATALRAARAAEQTVHDAAERGPDHD